nr:MAG TPA: hypothetical protein [Caudoviricetes sp.]
MVINSHKPTKNHFIVPPHQCPWMHPLIKDEFSFQGWCK